jgi:hypothetical protein
MRKTFLFICTLTSMAAMAAEDLASRKVGIAPSAADTPQIEFAFEERVTIDPAVVLGDTDYGHRQYIPITGGTIAGPKLKGQVLPGGWDFQLTYAASKCTELNADYFLKAEDGTVIHVFNQGMFCPDAPRGIFRPRLEAPKGPYGWMSHSTFVATLEIEEPKAQPGGGPPKIEAVRIRFYLVK